MLTPMRHGVWHGSVRHCPATRRRASPRPRRDGNRKALPWWDTAQGWTVCTPQRSGCAEGDAAEHLCPRRWQLVVVGTLVPGPRDTALLLWMLHGENNWNYISWENEMRIQIPSPTRRQT